jgi:hypothetical protein
METMGEWVGLVSRDLADSLDSMDSVSLGSTVPTLGLQAMRTPRDFNPLPGPAVSSPISRLELD